MKSVKFIASTKQQMKQNIPLMATAWIGFINVSGDKLQSQYCHNCLEWQIFKGNVFRDKEDKT